MIKPYAKPYALDGLTDSEKASINWLFFKNSPQEGRKVIGPRETSI